MVKTERDRDGSAAGETHDAARGADAAHERDGERALEQIVARHGSTPDAIARGLAELPAVQHDAVMAAVHRRFGNSFAGQVRQAMSGPPGPIAQRLIVGGAGAGGADGERAPGEWHPAAAGLRAPGEWHPGAATPEWSVGAAAPEWFANRRKQGQ